MEHSFERIIQYLSDKFLIPSANIRLIGSGKTGFKISSKQYGKHYISEESDLDFSVIDEKLFLQLQNEFNSWSADYSSGRLKPATVVQEGYWISNNKSVPKNLKFGFIDSYKIPNYNQYPFTKSVNQSMFLIKRHLEDVLSIKIKGASVRIYKDWTSFIKQLTTNLDRVLLNELE